MKFRRARFADVIARQLESFAPEIADLLAEIDAAHEAYRRTSRVESEEVYGDYQDAIDAAAERLAEIRDTYARTLDEPERYVDEFNREVVARWRLRRVADF